MFLWLSGPRCLLTNKGMLTTMHAIGHEADRMKMKNFALEIMRWAEIV